MVLRCHPKHNAAKVEGLGEVECLEAVGGQGCVAEQG